MKNKKLFYNKIAKGLVSFAAIILLLSSILAASIHYNNNITANAIRDVESGSGNVLITEVGEIHDLSYLNEGWYEIRSGFVFYLDTFDSYIPLYIKVKNSEQQNGLLAVDGHGNIKFGEIVHLLKEKEIVDEDEVAGNEITGEVTGFEGVTGYAPKKLPAINIRSSDISLIEKTIKNNKLKISKEQVIALMAGESGGVHAANVVMQVPNPAKPPSDFVDKTKQEISEKYGVLPGLVIPNFVRGGTQELKVRSVSVGPMQLNELYYKPEELKDRSKNIEAGTKYFGQLYDWCDGSFNCAVRAYNEGHSKLQSAKNAGKLEIYVAEADAYYSQHAPRVLLTPTQNLLLTSNEYLSELQSEQGQTLLAKIGSTIVSLAKPSATEAAEPPKLGGINPGSEIYYNGELVTYLGQGANFYSLSSGISVPLNDPKLSTSPPTFSTLETFASSRVARLNEVYSIGEDGKIRDAQNKLIAQLSGNSDDLKNQDIRVKLSTTQSRTGTADIISYEIEKLSKEQIPTQDEALRNENGDIVSIGGKPATLKEVTYVVPDLFVEGSIDYNLGAIYEAGGDYYLDKPGLEKPIKVEPQTTGDSKQIFVWKDNKNGEFYGLIDGKLQVYDDKVKDGKSPSWMWSVYDPRFAQAIDEINKREIEGLAQVLPEARPVQAIVPAPTLEGFTEDEAQRNAEPEEGSSLPPRPEAKGIGEQPAIEQAAKPPEEKAPAGLLPEPIREHNVGLVLNVPLEGTQEEYDARIIAEAKSIGIFKVGPKEYRFEGNNVDDLKLVEIKKPLGLSWFGYFNKDVPAEEAREFLVGYISEKEAPKAPEKEQETVKVPAPIAPATPKEESEFKWYNPSTWTLLKKEQEPLSKSQTSPAEKIPIRSRQEIDIAIKDLERQYEEKRKQGADRSSLIPLEIEIGRLKNTAPPSERYIKLAEAAGLLDSTAQKYYDGDVKQVKVQDLNWELKNKLGAEFQSGGKTYEFKLNTETYEYEIYSKDAKEPVSESAYPDLQNAKPLGQKSSSSSQVESGGQAPGVSQGLPIQRVSKNTNIETLFMFTEKLNPERKSEINTILKGFLTVGDIDEKGNFKGQTVDGRPVFIPRDGSAIYYPELDDAGKLVWIERKNLESSRTIPVKSLPTDFQNSLQTEPFIVTYKDPLTGTLVYGRLGETIFILEPNGEEYEVKIPEKLEDPNILEVITISSVSFPEGTPLEVQQKVAQLPEAPRRDDLSLDTDAIGPLYAQAGAPATVPVDSITKAIELIKDTQSKQFIVAGDNPSEVKKEAQARIEANREELTKLIISSSIPEAQFNVLARQRLAISEMAEITTRVEAARSVTSSYQNAIINQIKPYGGNPNEWRLDQFGNFICAKDYCGVGENVYLRGQTFAPSGGDPAGKNFDANRDALVKLQGDSAAAPPPLQPLVEPPTQLATKEESEKYLKGAATTLPQGTKRVDYGAVTKIDDKPVDYAALSQGYGILKTGNEIYLVTGSNPEIGYEAKALKISGTEAMIYGGNSEHFVVIPLADVPKGIQIEDPFSAKPSAPVPGISAVSTLNPQGQPTGTLGIVKLQQAAGQAPVAGTPFRREQGGPQKIEQHLVQVAENQYNVVTIYKNPDGSYEVSVNQEGTRADPNDPTKGYKALGPQAASSVKIPAELIPKDIQLNQWGADPKIIPLAGNGVRTWQPDSSGGYEANDKYYTIDPSTKEAKVTKERLVIVPADKSHSIETLSTYDRNGKIISSTQLYIETPIGSIGTRRTITALPGTQVAEPNGQLKAENIKSVAFENYNGKKVEVAPEAFRQASEKISSEREALFFFSEIANRGIGNVQAVQIEKDGKVVVGDKNNRVEWVRGEAGGIIAAYEGSNLVGYAKPDTNDPKGGTYFSLREGSAELKDGVPMLKDGATAHIQQIANRQLVSDRIEQQTSGELVSLEIKDRAEKGIMVASVTKKDSETPSVFTISSSEIKGYLKAEQVGEQTYYVKTGEDDFGLPFGLGGGEIYKKDANGKLVRADTSESIAVKNILNKERESRNLPTFEQVSSQRFFSNVDRILTEFQGLGYYATLFFEEDDLLKWRDDVDRTFATLYLGTEYWSSSICGQYLDGEDDGIAYAETPQGLSQVAAHIEATRSEPILTPTGEEFIYKITFNVRNGDYDKDPRAPEEMHINVILRGDKTVAIFKQEQRVKRGSSFGRIGRNAIVQDSTAFYNEICLTFDNTPLRWKVSNNEICNTIVESSGAPTAVAAAAASPTSTGGSSSVEGDVNDF